MGPLIENCCSVHYLCAQCDPSLPQYISLYILSGCLCEQYTTMQVINEGLEGSWSFAD